MLLLHSKNNKKWMEWKYILYIFIFIVIAIVTVIFI